MSAWRSTLTLVAVVAVLAAGCVPGPGSQSPGVSPQASTGPQRLVTAIKGDPPTLSDKINSSGAGGVPGVSEVERLIAGGLTVRDDKGTLRSQLAQSVPTVENGLWRLLPNGRMDTTWTIAPGARWHDGTRLTADDLVFTAQLSRDRELPQLRDTTLDALESVEVVDPYTVVAHWRQPYIDADSLFGAGKALPLPQHLLGPTYAENKAALVEQPYWTRDFAGLGPFKVREWVAGSH